MNSQLTKNQIKEICEIQKNRIEELKKSIHSEAASVNKARKDYTHSLLESMVATLHKYEAMA